MKRIDRNLPVVLAFGLMLCLGSCAEKDAPGYATFRPRSDATVRSQILSEWQRVDPALQNALTLQIGDGVVTVSGSVASEQDRINAMENVWNAEGVREVVNEIRINAPVGNKQVAKDNATAVKLRTRLTFDPSISSVDYSIEVMGDTVYLMGRAQSQDEMDKVIAYARSMPSVAKVVSYVKILR